MKAIDKGQIWTSKKVGHCKFVRVSSIENGMVTYRPAGVHPLGIGGSALLEECEPLETFVHRLVDGEYGYDPSIQNSAINTLDNYPICNGQLWRTMKETFVPTIQIIKVSNGKVHAAYYAGIERVEQTHWVEEFVSLLDQGGYVLDYTPPGSMKPARKLSKVEGKIDQDAFDRMIGGMDRLLSVMILFAKGQLDDANWQTMKHHAEDMKLAADKVLELYGTRDGKPKPQPPTKEVIKPPPENTFPPLVQKGDLIYFKGLEVTAEAHEFCTYEATRGSGLRKESHTWTACRFCGLDLERYDNNIKPSPCPKLNTP